MAQNFNKERKSKILLEIIRYYLFIVLLGHPVYCRKDAPTCRQTAVREAVEVVCCRRRLQVESTSIPASLTRFTSFFFSCLHNILSYVSILFFF